MGASLRAALDRDFAPVRYRPPWERALLPLGTMAAVVGAGFTLLGRPPVASSSTWMLTAVVLALAVMGVVLGVWRGASGLGVPLRWRHAWFTSAAGVFSLLLVSRTGGQDVAATSDANLAHMGTSTVNAVVDPHQLILGPMQSLGTCASTTSVFAGVVAFAAFWAVRRTVPVSPGNMGALLGAAAGLTALAALEPSCTGGVLHALVAHGGPALLATVLGLFLGRRALAP
jgi:hypothetical protein